MLTLAPDDPRAVAVTAAIRSGDVPGLRALLSEHQDLPTAWVGDAANARSMLHIVADWPGHVPRGAEAIAVLVAAGADVNARHVGRHAETPLHWAASSDDVAVLDALLDAGAAIDAPGAVIAGGTPLEDACAFAQWNAARRLVARHATVRLEDAASLGLSDLVADLLSAASPEDVHRAFWYAAHGGQQATAQLLLGHGADVNWLPPWERLTPLDAARRNGFDTTAAWLTTVGGCGAADL